MSFDFEKMEKQLDYSLANETEESAKKWLFTKRMDDILCSLGSILFIDVIKSFGYHPTDYHKTKKILDERIETRKSLGAHNEQS